MNDIKINFASMNTAKSVERDLYYTKDHEWIDFQGSVAYVGVCQHKLSPGQSIQEIVFLENQGFLKQGQLLCNLQYASQTIPVYMPVDGKIMRVNEVLLEKGDTDLMRQSKLNGWIVLIVPSLPYGRTGLMQPAQYVKQLKK